MIPTIETLICEPSPIIRYGITEMLNSIHHLQLNIHHTTPENLVHSVKEGSFDLILINPSTADQGTLLSLYNKGVDPPKKIGLVTGIINPKILKMFDGTINLFSTKEQIYTLLTDFFVHDKKDKEEDEEENQLTPREREIVIDVSKGFSNKKIAERLFLSTHTVNTHRRNIAKKLEIHSVSGLTVYAIVNNLVKLEDIK
ncbi:MAG: LuxR C-terminal-related transcriptional regulator [Massilibacteroides sp.]|nr:LuxR C-terminal-related transcriptional regulator [Massilibacteroides sp.]